MQERLCCRMDNRRVVRVSRTEYAIRKALCYTVAYTLIGLGWLSLASVGVAFILFIHWLPEVLSGIL